MVTFLEAAASYIKNGGEDRYLNKILPVLGGDDVSQITPYRVYEVVKMVYPDHAPSSQNRQGITPIRAVMIHAYERGWCPVIRLRKFRGTPKKRKTPATATWLHLFVRQCDKDGLDHLAALVIFMAQTGARISEAVRLEWSEVDLLNRRATLRKTKTDTDSVRHLTDELVRRLHKMEKKDPVFRYKSRYSVNDRIRAVCLRAGIPYKSSHVCGRHTFATLAMQLGMDVKTAMDAGGWKSSSVFINTYVHSKNASQVAVSKFNQIDLSNDL